MTEGQSAPKKGCAWCDGRIKVMKTGKECVCEEDCGCGACGKMLVGGFRLSTASSKPAPSLKRYFMDAGLEGIVFPREDFLGDWVLFADVKAILEPSPAAERTAPTREAIERILFKMVTEHKDKIDIGKAADEIIALDAQEKAGVKAEICNAWHGNDFSQCQLPKGHEGNHLCIMTWEWPTASNAASEQEKSL